MQTLFESIMDIDKNIDDDSAICLVSYWKPTSFSCTCGPVELLKLLKQIDYKKLKNFEKDIKVNLIDYTVMRPWNKKAIQQKVEELFKPILSQHSWNEVFEILNNCTPNHFKIRDFSAIKNTFKLDIIDQKDHTAIEINFMKK